MLHPSKQHLKNLDPAAHINDDEFNDISLKFGSFISMAHNKCLNHVATLAIIMKNDDYKQVYKQLVGSDNIYELIQTFIDNTPNLYKKVAKKVLFK